ncbi:carboxypeptidase-like regulatory domain-containing protein [Bremerella sp. T1]|uniref:carboxypeptidase-like regulatory domain-containing protein n=1 Tax=Bremerella sp. TYQ1 TaxID=3119568 RepID=UPI001CCE0757|nr:carboxypeptidase-like regulatory domain-containing protein [Bremerella volcania]UBM37768.1 carboxypeptidase-like regulatory domain-containing protein [Bremerella volcania]
MQRLSWVTLCLVATAPLFGCNSSGNSEVTGKITRTDGQAVTGGRITFTSQNPPVSASSRIAPDGSYELSSVEPGDGAPAGRYQVTIVSKVSSAGGDDRSGRSIATSKSLVHEKYADLRTSELTAEVNPGANSIDFEVDPPK